MRTDGLQCAHIWAQQTHESGEGYGAIRFEGDTLYSYAEPIARIVKNARGTAALMRDRTFSVTTSRHQGYARYAVSHLQCFTVPDIGRPHSDDTRKNYEKKIEALAVGAVRSRRYGESTLARAKAMALEANNCAAFFDLDWRLEVPTISPEVLADMRAKAKAANLKEKQRREERERRDLEAMREHMTEWVAGRAHSVPWGCHETLLRINGDRIQTSRGAEIPVSHARRLWPIIAAVKARGAEYEVDREKGYIERAGEFKLERIAADGTITVGCHTIKFDQIERIAKELGLA